MELYASIHETREREAQRKRWQRAWKIELIEAANPDWRDLAGSLFE